MRFRIWQGAVILGAAGVLLVLGFAKPGSAPSLEAFVPEGGKESAFTTTALTPLVVMDTESEAYQESIISHKRNRIPEEALKELSGSILEADLEIGSRAVDDVELLFSILYTDNANRFVLYIMTPTGTFCAPPKGMSPGCDNAKLKILDTASGSIDLLTDNFAEGGGDVYVSEKDNMIIVVADFNYMIFDLDEQHTLRQSTPDGFSSLLQNEYAISYNAETGNLTVDNLLNDRQIDCEVADPGLRNALSANFDYSHFSIAPNGNKFVIFDSADGFLWADISDEWVSSASGCLNNVQRAELIGIESIERMGDWYADSEYFASSEYGREAYIYDFNAGEQIFFMSWEGATGVGYVNNFGYHDSASIDENIIKAIVVPEEGQISIYFEMSDGERYLVNSYEDENSTERFQGLIIEYPVNSLGSFTSGKLHGEGVPRTWIRLEQDGVKKDLYHLLVLDGYNLRQALDVVVRP